MDTVTLPELGRLCGLTPQALYSAVERGDGPELRPRGKQHVVPHTAAIAWIERRLRRPLPPAHRRALETALTDLRVERAFARARP